MALAASMALAAKLAASMALAAWRQSGGIDNLERHVPRVVEPVADSVEHESIDCGALAKVEYDPLILRPAGECGAACGVPTLAHGGVGARRGGGLRAERVQPVGDLPRRVGGVQSDS
eukprot:gene8181-biopygen10142